VDHNIQSDTYIQIKSSKLAEIKALIEEGGKYSPFKSSKNTKIKITNQEAYELLRKAINIVKDTEEYVAYLLDDAFGDGKDKKYSTPPGTVRFYAKDLICFYTGKTWRKITL